MRFERELLTMFKKNAYRHLTNDLIIMLCLLWLKLKQLYLFDYYKPQHMFIKYKMLNVSFKTVFHALAQ